MIISNFKNLESVNSYTSEFFDKEYFIPLTADQSFLYFVNVHLFQTFVENNELSSITSDYVSSHLTEGSIATYNDYLSTYHNRPNFLFPASKTKFIRNALSDFVPSFAKKYYELLVANNNVLYTSTSFCIFTNIPITLASFSTLNSQQVDFSSILEDLSLQLSSNLKDQEYLIKIIDSLEKQVLDLQKENEQLNAKVVDSYTITWN